MRLRRWLRYYRERKRPTCPEDKDFAVLLDVSPSHVSNMLDPDGERTPGLDLALKMSEAFGIELDRLVKDEPPQQHATEGPMAPPSAASPSAAKPGRRRAGGGK